MSTVSVQGQSEDPIAAVIEAFLSSTDCDPDVIATVSQIPAIRAAVAAVLQRMQGPSIHATSTFHVVSPTDDESEGIAEVMTPPVSTVLQNKASLEYASMVVAGCPRMEQVWQDVQVYGKSPLTMLFRGERGSGKELFPRAVHHLRGETGPFVVQNCAAVNDGIVESELFGHVKGAFTDAHSERIGLFEQVKDGGTILLDEIGDMPTTQQAKLLRVLENRRFRRVGGNVEIVLGPACKIVAATNKNLEQLIEEGKFRADLYDRLRGCEIVIPPLRERSLDHRAFLIQHFLATFGKPDRPLRLSSRAHDYVCGLDYPGNVRALGHHVQRASLLAEATALPHARHVEISLETMQRAQDGTHTEYAPLRPHTKGVTETFLNGALEVTLPDDFRVMDATLAFSISLSTPGTLRAWESIIRGMFCAALLKRGLSKAEISDQLHITRATVRQYVECLHMIDTRLRPEKNEE